MKKHILNDYFDKVYCINLAERPDKRKKMEERFHKLGIEVEWFTPVTFGFAPKIVPTLVKANVAHFNIQHPNEIGAALSHYTVIKRAFLEGHDQIFVFEDDAKFDTMFNDKIGKYLDSAPGDANMLMFYSYMYEFLPQNKKMNSRWMTAFRAWSLMAYGMDRIMMKAYIKEQDNHLSISDHATFKLQENKDLHIYSSMPSICIPDTQIASNIRKKMNYDGIGTLTDGTVSITNLGVSNKNYE